MSINGVCKRCSDPYCFGGCIPFKELEDVDESKSQFHEKGFADPIGVKYDGETDKYKYVSVGYATEDSKPIEGTDHSSVNVLIGARPNSLKFIDDKAGFENWFKQECGVYPDTEASMMQLMMYKSWMAARGWRI